jgi:hypothetical protein
MVTVELFNNLLFEAGISADPGKYPRAIAWAHSHYLECAFSGMSKEEIIQSLRDRFYTNYQYFIA